MAGCDFVVSVFMLLMFFASLVMLSLLSGLCSVWFIVCAFCGLHEGHFYMRTAPLLAPVSTVGKSRLVVVAVQGAPQIYFFDCLGKHSGKCTVAPGFFLMLVGNLSNHC